MKYAIVLFALCGLMVSGVVTRVSAQTTESPGSKGVDGAKVSNISISQANQAVSSSFADGADDTPQATFAKVADIATIVPDIFKPFRENYYKTIELVQISWPRLVGGPNGKFGGRLALGLNHPQYILQKQLKELGVAGSLDLKIDGIIGGIVNSARITIIYDFRRSFSSNDTRMNIFVDRISFKMGIPVGRW